jgi:hypothetical protein
MTNCRWGIDRAWGIVPTPAGSITVRREGTDKNIKFQTERNEDYCIQMYDITRDSLFTDPRSHFFNHLPGFIAVTAHPQTVTPSGKIRCMPGYIRICSKYVLKIRPCKQCHVHYMVSCKNACIIVKMHTKVKIHQCRGIYKNSIPCAAHIERDILIAPDACIPCSILVIELYVLTAPVKPNKPFAKAI